MTTVNYASSIVNKLKALHTDDARVVIYDCHVLKYSRLVLDDYDFHLFAGGQHHRHVGSRGDDQLTQLPTRQQFQQQRSNLKISRWMELTFPGYGVTQCL